MTTVTNQLGQSNSAYLLQHQSNPVAWQQWNADTLALAKQQDKPILLSIGYSACEWCHQMAAESFSDQEIAQLMNSMFINIKVDREERQDLDRVYQHAHEFLTGRPGGWPLTVFLCPRTLLPFLVGTYFPKEDVNNRIGFKQLLEKVNEYYGSRGKDFIDTLDEVKKRYEELNEVGQTLDKEAELNLIPVDKAIVDVLKDADMQFGGFGNAPKFAMPNLLERLFASYIDQDANSQQALNHLNFSLRSLARSGIVDQVDGGFFRYSTDTQWMIPHFEKMLYDNALMLSVCAQALSVQPDPEIETLARDTATWILTQLGNKEGGFFSAVTVGKKGQAANYYCWAPQVLDAVLDQKEKALISNVFDLDRFPNYREHYHFHRQRDWATIVAELELGPEEFQATYRKAIAKLQHHRAQQPAEADHHILTGWNGLMIRALAITGRVLNEKAFVFAAQKTVDFIRNNLWLNKRLYGGWCDGELLALAYMDDYAYLVDGLIELLRVNWRDEDYLFVGQLLESMMSNFEDEDHGGFYFTPHDGEELIFRDKTFHDAVLPSGNGIAAKVLGRYGHLTTEPHYLNCAERTLRCAWASMLRTPKMHHSCLLALSEYLRPPLQVLLKGDSSMEFWRNAIQQKFGEQVHCYLIPDDSELHPPELFLLEDNQGLLCIGDQCLEPQNNANALIAQIDSAINNQSK